MLSQEGSNRVKQKQPVQIRGDAGHTDKDDSGEHMSGGIRPDIMIPENWPLTGGVDQAIMREKGRADESPTHHYIIAELGFSSDLGFQKTVDRKQHKYAPLIKELEEEGWNNVRPTVHVITVGAKATMPIINVEVLKSASKLKRSRRSRKSKPAIRT
jgi:hypothetical protein